MIFTVIQESDSALARSVDPGPGPLAAQCDFKLLILLLDPLYAVVKGIHYHAQTTSLCFLFLILGIESRALYIPGKASTMS